MITCPKCDHKFHVQKAKRQSFEIRAAELAAAIISAGADADIHDVPSSVGERRGWRLADLGYRDPSTYDQWAGYLAAKIIAHHRFAMSAEPENEFFYHPDDFAKVRTWKAGALGSLIECTVCGDLGFGSPGDGRTHIHEHYSQSLVVGAQQ